MKRNEYNFNGIIFDDTIDEDGRIKYWSQICQSCTDKYSIDEKLLDIASGIGYCGVKGCNNEADHYIDFPGT